MTEGTTGDGRPRTILLATDMSARCDRALDRAVQLAAEWGSRLVIVHAIAEAGIADMGLPTWRSSDPAAEARRQLRSDAAEIADQAVLVVERGPPADVIVDVAGREGCDLIVLGIARDELFGRYSLGSTVDRLLRGAPAPLLVVKGRGRPRYDNIVVASDFSQSSRHALETAARLFPDRRLTVFHGSEPPMENLIPDVTAYRREARAAAIAEGMRFLAETPRQEHGWPEPELVVEHGEPAERLRHYARQHRTDLVVLSTHGRSAIFEVFIGSVAKRILDRLPCDALVVREPRSKGET